ncbi:hypothetical protein M5W83_24520 [Paenibacillus thiaminolyticus]|uniref:Uncharacterized protein n=1 Tax=Paenibacillus thiaminolyticus TaxID=49283 RepID=A0AAP9J2G5_PANTH|nr:hypothetical protein [Paenibacillus thiaminolyticus]MCY9534008.1 hypothetical protein [Paenibacillus thiaminolyticus]MCY9603763.1 hypothetical protein [Paenibacillus thiaminolyticus]MCY9610318.1 hypothetical protein [Paenibacillus thiaminolyticus]MCY9614526.1 hypothetical protein [Paenibacillus thiaminolyticus]MCY9618945.1 hypothetical protein [Paenibacillus thiaminolyticus]
MVFVWENMLVTLVLMLLPVLLIIGLVVYARRRQSRSRGQQNDREGTGRTPERGIEPQKR